MTGDADFSSLKEDQAEHTMSLSDFIKLKNEYALISYLNRTRAPKV
jgi:hypothetical protein